MKAGGYFTQAFFLRSHSPAKVEKLLGYGSGTLDQGWWLMFLMDMPADNQFEVRGMTYMSDGIIEGHKPAHERANPSGGNAEQRLREGGYNLSIIKRNLRTDLFKLSGPNRLAKVRPVAEPPSFPAGAGIPQWKLTCELNFYVAAFMKPGEAYLGDYK